MDTKEFELALNDLETRVDRLRALYENWFRGYEKTEPQVARKDVERKVYALRKELPRNTALRFRYHQLFQRYTTLANYWQRTAKQIEEGTYRLQLQRLRRRATPDARRELNEIDEVETNRPPPRAYELDLEQSLDLDDLLDEPTQPPPAMKATPALRPAPVEPMQSGVVGTTRLAPPPAVARPAPAVPASAARPSLPPLPPSVQPGSRSVPPTGVRPMPAPTAAQGSAAGRPAPTSPLGTAAGRPAPTSPLGTAAGRPAPTAPQSTANRPAPRPAPQATSGPLPNEQRLRSLYDEYTAARRRNNEGEIRYENLVSSIKKMLPDLQNKHQGKSIDFDVVVKDGRVGLKPRVRIP